METTFAPVMDKVVVVFAHGSEGLQSFQGLSTQSLTTLETGMGYWLYTPSATTLSIPDFQYSLFPGWNQIGWVGADTPVGTVMSSRSNDIYFVLGFDAPQQGWVVYQSPLATSLVELQKGATYYSFMDTTGGTVSLSMGDKTLTLSQFGSWKWDP